tara:strand:+ start:3630 stop:3908 length:279 start_codon:yes stop_codon:yes gene_type:complete
MYIKLERIKYYLDNEDYHKILRETCLEKYEKELNNLNNKDLQTDYIGWFCLDYKIEELENVGRKEMIHDLVEDKRTYLIGYEVEELEDYINN